MLVAGVSQFTWRAGPVNSIVRLYGGLMKITVDLDQLLQDQRITPEEADRLRGLAVSQSPERRTRGLWSVVVPAVVGLAVGGLLGATVLAQSVVAAVVGRDSAILQGLISGGLTGLLVGGAAGALLWAFFPYKAELRN
jgi:hypothetical protein